MELNEELRERICTRCDFYGGKDDDLECQAFKLARQFILEGKLQLEDL